MNATNETQDSASYFCQLLGPFLWRQEYMKETAVYVNVILSTIINSVLFPFTTFFNLLLVYIIFFKRKFRRKKSYVSIGYLAITDLAVGVVLQPMFVAIQLCRISGGCKICVLDFMFYFLGLLFCRSSMNHLVIIAWERYVAIKHALRYEIIVTRKKLLCASIAAWLIPLLLEGLLAFETNPFVPLIVVSLYIFICFSILAYFYVAIFIESRRHQRQIKATTPYDQREANRSINGEFRAAKTTFIIISCFAICYIPFIVGSTVIYLLSLSTSSSDPNWILVTLLPATLFLFNSLINPIIYGWRDKEIKEMVKDIFARKLNSIETKIALREKRVLPQSIEKIHGNSTTCSTTDRRTERSLSIPAQLTSSAYVNPNKRRRHTLHEVINTNIDSDNKYHFYLQSDSGIKSSEVIENERNEITITAVVHVNSVSKQDEHSL